MEVSLSTPTPSNKNNSPNSLTEFSSQNEQWQRALQTLLGRDHHHPHQEGVEDLGDLYDGQNIPHHRLRDEERRVLGQGAQGGGKDQADEGTREEEEDAAGSAGEGRAGGRVFRLRSVLRCDGERFGDLKVSSLL